MPQADPENKITLTIPNGKDSAGNTVYRFLTVVTVQKNEPPKANRPVDTFNDIIVPLVLVFGAAALLIWLVSGIKPGSRTDKILSRIERILRIKDADQ